jgi:adenylosuccinate synthase
MKAHAVIGMNYGDEGKGQITNFLSNENTLNIRFNGGAQAAHTVVLNDGTEHVFHHFGSGSLKGARTLLSSHFIVNPLVFMREFEELSRIRKGWREVLIDPTCRVTTPYDMLINEFDAKFHKKNDTCGLGIYETIERSVFRQLCITARDMAQKTESELLAILRVIENEYIPWRLKKLELPADEFKTFATPFLLMNKFDENFIECTKIILKNSAVFSEDRVVERFLAKGANRSLVFEGAQGMILDRDRKESYPYITPSSTGVKNIVELLTKVSTPIELEVILATRAYLSRHGDGPIRNSSVLPYGRVSDPSNPENKFQGKIRYGFLDKAWYDSAIMETWSSVGKLKSATVAVGMTCLDQLDNYSEKTPLESTITYSDKGIMKNGKIRDVFQDIAIISTGRNEQSVKRV